MTDANRPPLPRVLGPWMAAAVVTGTVIGSGVFKKASVVAGNVPEFGLAVLVWVAGGVLAVLGGLAYAEVVCRYPRAGGNYVFLREGYGRWAGFLWGWTDFGIIRSASIAVLATMATEAGHDVLKRLSAAAGGPSGDLLGFWPRQGVTVGIIAALTAVNMLGTRLGAKLQLVLTVLKVGSLAGLMLLPLAVYLLAPAAPHAPTTAHMTPAWPADWADVDWGRFGAALVGVLWAYHGWMNLGPVAEEVKDPQRNIPLAILGGVLVVTLAYVGVNVAYYTALSADDMARLTNTSVAAAFCLQLAGSAGALAASLIVLTSVLGSLNGNVLVAPRLLYAMADDKLAPTSLRELHPVYRTPARAMAAFSGWACALVLGLGALTQYRLPAVEVGGLTADVNLPAGKVPYDVLTDYAIFGAVIFETMAVAALFVFRARRVGDPPYRCPGYPVVPAVYVLAMAAVAVNMVATPVQRAEAVIGLGYIAAGAAVYSLFLRQRVTRSVG